MKLKRLISIILCISMLTVSIQLSIFSTHAESNGTNINADASEYRTASKHFYLDDSLPLSGNVCPLYINIWSDTLDSVYESFVELTGFTTCYGKRITIQTSSETYGGAWVYGHPYPYIYIQEEQAPLWFSNIQKQIKSGNIDLGFGFLHECGHLFDVEAWIFDAELMANFKMAYVLEKLNLPVDIGYNWGPEKLYTGSEIKSYYYNAYRDTNNMNDKFSGDAFTYTLLDIKDIIGWDSYSKAYRKLIRINDINHNKNIKITNSEKLNLFFTMIRSSSNYDIMSYYSKSQLDNLSSNYGGEIKYNDLYGDVNSDGTISISDCTNIQQYLIGSHSVNQSLSDINNDDKVSIYDATEIQKYLVNKSNNDIIETPR